MQCNRMVQRSRAARVGPSPRLAPPRTSTVVRAQTGTKTALKLPRWEDMWGYLVREKGMKSITPQEAQRMQSDGWVLVDVRLKQDYDNSHPEGAVSVPMYQLIDFKEVDAAKVIKTLFYRFNGVNPVEPNPGFIDQVKALVGGSGAKKGVIFLCEAGGTLAPSTNFPTGKASRSLQAAYRVLSEGVTNRVAHMDRGAYGWWQAGFDFDGSADYRPDIGRTPSAAAEPTLKNIQDSVGYEVKPGDKAVEQQKKDKFWPWD